MRFAYIDSHGNEVPIPSVDALALRIELGAIGPDTQLYDAQADRWGPASTHEIFHTLARDSQAEDGMMAPPPVAPPPPPPKPAATPAAKPKPKPKPKAGPKQPEPVAEVKAADLGLTLAAPPPPQPPKRAAAAAPAAAFDLSLDLAAPLDVTPSLGGGPANLDPLGGGPGGGQGTFDYGDLGSGLQLEDSPLHARDASAGLGGGKARETPMQFGGDAGSGDLQLEEPMSAFRPDAPPGWMEQGSPGGVMDFAAPAAAEPEAPLTPVAAPPSRERRAAKDRPSPPKFKSQRSLALPIVLVVIFLALGVGGYWGWPLLSARLSQPEAPVRPAIVMPALPPELLPRMRTLAEGAFADAIAEVDVNTTSPETPAEPDQQWLGGNYLANASQFGSIEAFWTGIETFMQGVRAAEWRLYHDKLLGRAQAEGIAADTVAMIVERADSGFVAAQATRSEAYATIDALVDAALGLHDFLVLNEANIEYRPATTSTADPILEAVPSTAALGDQMLERVDAITDALARIGPLDRVTRERLTTALTTRLQQTGIQ